MDSYQEPNDELIHLMSKIVNRNATQDDIKQTTLQLAKIFGVKIDFVDKI